MKNNKTDIIIKHLIPNSLNNKFIIDLFSTIDRDFFVDKNEKSLAYIDEDYFFDNNRFILKNTTIAKFFKIIENKKFKKTLNIGATTGYTSILLSKISTHVFSLENEVSLHEKAKKNLKFFDIKNIDCIMGELANGFLDEKPYDLIFVNGCLEKYPNLLIDQLNKYNGTLLTIEKKNNYLKKIVKYLKKGKLIERKEYSQVSAPILKLLNLQ